MMGRALEGAALNYLRHGTYATFDILGRPRCGIKQRPHEALRVSAQAHQPAERVLRYVDGRERRIIYPAPDYIPLQELVIADADGVYRSFSETEQPDRWGSPDWDVTQAWMGNDIHPQNVPTQPTLHSTTSPTVQPSRKSSWKQQQQQKQLVQAEDPVDQLFAQFESAAYRDAQQRFWLRVADSYQVLESCPWPIPRPLHVLAVQQLTSPSAAMFTLRTRIRRNAAENELSKVLGHSRRSDGSAVVTMHHMAEGVIAFASEAAAERFGAALEAGGTDDVSLATVDSHALFRLTGDGSAVVVLVDDSQTDGQQFQASPGELEASLRSRGEDSF